MSRQWAKDVVEKQAIDEIYLVASKAMPLSRNGKYYLNLTLLDRSGELDARVWDNAESWSARFEDNDYLRVKATAVRFQDRIQLHVTKLEVIDSAELDPDDFLPRGENAQDIWRQSVELLDSLKNPHLKALMDRLLADEDFVEAYRRVPAGKSIHHARIGGLLEHNLSLCLLIDGICGVYAALYPGLLDRDLLIVAGFLHDVGKTQELSAERRFEYTTAGRLLGHIVLGHDLIARQIDGLEGFPEDLGLHLRHLLLSHHGQLEHGSPKRPKTAEAWILHFVDIMDCRIAQTSDLVAQLPPGAWTPYLKLHDRYLWRGHQHGDGDPDDAPTGDEPLAPPDDANDA